MPDHSIKKSKRKKLFISQGGLCHYCNKPMFDNDLSDARAFHLSKLKRDKFCINYHKQYVLKQLLCTLEHKERSEDGGGFLDHNLVVAHSCCNTARQGMCYFQHKFNKGKRVDVFKDYGWCNKGKLVEFVKKPARRVDLSIYGNLFKDLID